MVHCNRQKERDGILLEGIKELVGAYKWDQGFFFLLAKLPFLHLEDGGIEESTSV